MASLHKEINVPVSSDPMHEPWYAVKDTESYSSVRAKVVLHAAWGVQEYWLAHGLSHGVAAHVAEAHNMFLAGSPVICRSAGPDDAKCRQWCGMAYCTPAYKTPTVTYSGPCGAKGCVAPCTHQPPVPPNHKPVA